MPATDFHVNGPALVQVAFSSGAWTDLGYTEDGVEVEPDLKVEEIMTDQLGNQIPTEVAYMGETATLTARFVTWDTATMDMVEARFASGKVAGAVPEDCIGTLMKQGNKFIGVRYRGSARCGMTAEKFRQFPIAFARGPIPIKAGTRVTRMTVTFFAYPSAGILYTLVS